MSKIHRLIPALSNRLPDPTVEILGVDGVSAAVALWYIDKRAPDSGWRDLVGGKELERVSFCSSFEFLGGELMVCGCIVVCPDSGKDCVEGEYVRFAIISRIRYRRIMGMEWK